MWTVHTCFNLHSHASVRRQASVAVSGATVNLCDRSAGRLCRGRAGALSGGMRLKRAGYRVVTGRVTVIYINAKSIGSGAASACVFPYGGYVLFK